MFCFPAFNSNNKNCRRHLQPHLQCAASWRKLFVRGDARTTALLFWSSSNTRVLLNPLPVDCTISWRWTMFELKLVEQGTLALFVFIWPIKTLYPYSSGNWKSDLKNSNLRSNMGLGLIPCKPWIPEFQTLLFFLCVCGYVTIFLCGKALLHTVLIKW